MVYLRSMYGGKRKYGTDSATIVKFCNKVSVALEEYFNENPQYKRNVNILFFAYHKTETAPVKINENGEFEPIDNSVICRDNVYCFYAPIFANYTYSFYDGENKTYADTMDAWCVLSKSCICGFTAQTSAIILHLTTASTACRTITSSPKRTMQATCSTRDSGTRMLPPVSVISRHTLTLNCNGTSLLISTLW